MQRTSIILLLAAVLTACETVVEVAPPDHEPRLVADGFFTADSSWAVRVTSTISYVSSMQPSVVTGAHVTIEDDAGTTLQLTSQTPGLYTGTGLTANPGRSYRLHVEADAFEPTEGRAVLPETPRVAEMRVKSAMKEGLHEVELTLVIDDPDGRPNYYGLFLVQSRWRVDASGAVTSLQPTLATFESDDVVLEETALGVLDRGNRRYRDAFFDDAGFDGRRRSIPMTFRYAPFDPQHPVIRVFTVVIVEATRDLYQYWKTADHQRISGENPFAEPIRVHSNMSAGVGIFAGFGYRLLPVTTDSLGLDTVCAHVSTAVLPCRGTAGSRRSIDAVKDLIFGQLGFSDPALTH